MLQFYKQFSSHLFKSIQTLVKPRFYASQTPKGNPSSDSLHNKNLKSTLYYVTAGGILVVGLSYAAVPLYRMFCQVRKLFCKIAIILQLGLVFRHIVMVAPQIKVMMPKKFKVWIKFRTASYAYDLMPI